MTATLNDKTLRMALVLREAGVLDETHWQAVAKQVGATGEKSLRQVLFQEASLGAIKDFLTLDVVTLKSGKASTASDMAKTLRSAVKLLPDEILSMLKANQPDVARLCHHLIRQKLMTEGALVSALDLAEKNALNVYDVLCAQKLISPEIVEQSVADHQTEFGQDNRTLLAGDILIYNSLITKEDYSKALESRAVTMAPLSQTLENLKYISQDDLVATLERGIELPMVDLAACDVAPELLQRFPTEFMRRQLFVPLTIQDNNFEIGTADPFNLSLADAITLLTGKRVSMIYASHSDLLAKLETLVPQSDTSGKPLMSMPMASAPRVIKPAAKTSAEGVGEKATRVAEGDTTRKPAEVFVDNLSAVQLVSQIIESAVDIGATDIHIEPQLEAVRVRYRVDGLLHNVMKTPTEMALSITSRIKALASMNVTERRRPLDGHLSFETRNGSYDFRISTLPSVYGEKIVMRVLDSSRVMTGLPDLGLEPEQNKTMERMVLRPHGLILVTGPTGSGKTSTLYACLSTANNEGSNIITIEDPVEYMLEGITQVQVDANIDLTFANGLRSALRQDPDVIMVGEVRDADTAQTAIRAALTGHLVFSTLHTNMAVGAISSLTHMGIPHYLIASALSGIIGQRLVRKICEDCKESYSAPKPLLKELGVSEGTRKKIYHGKGCSRCLNTGYRGRTGLFEVVEVTGDLRRAIAAGTGETELEELAALRGDTLKAVGIKKIFAGITTPEEVVKAVVMQ
ncbi:MAG: Flp pilus assembly complex ATPase component TadA [Candidatus Sumerlaeaceae bacterium]|nr:Flp pilus assembly complex ATPase component TadA [Candidatus Sumerlaeaceae bacterium]